MKKIRDIGLDVTRIVAYLSVVCVHFFLNNGFYNTPMIGKRMYFMAAMRTAFMVCVPLFMILTGYLSSSKHISITPRCLLHYYGRLEPILLTYVMADILILLVKCFYFKEALTWGDGLKNILSYQQYAWYINMYIGLALLIPFLNVLWQGLQSKQEQRCLVLIFLALTMIPSILNIYIQLVPNWWGGLYPITYYYIGAYLKYNIDFKKESPIKIFLMLLVVWGAFSVRNIWNSKNRCFVWNAENDWGGGYRTY